MTQGADSEAKAGDETDVAAGPDTSSTGTRRRSDHSLAHMETLASGEVPLDTGSGRVIPPTQTPVTGPGAPRASGAPDAELEVGQRLEHYRVVEHIAGGGMGAVYVVEHVELGKRFAAKVVLPALAGLAGAVERLKQEARALSAVDHPNIVNVSHLGTTEEGLVYVVMELLEGEDLGDRLKRQRAAAEEGDGDPWLPDEEVRHLVPQLLSALSAAHRAGVVHRDLKPDNVFLSKRHDRVTVKVVDFGISKVRDPGKLPVGLTQTGQILGTPLYMAPEQSRSTSQVDARADLYSLGCILYELVTGTVPFSAQSPYECVVMHTVEPVPKPSERRADIPPAVEQVILRCLEKQPGNRFGSAAELLEAWEAAWEAPAPNATGAAPEPELAGKDTSLPSEPTRAGFLRWLGPVLATVALLAGGSFFLRSAEAPTASVAVTDSDSAPRPGGAIGETPARPVTTVTAQPTPTAPRQVAAPDEPTPSTEPTEPAPADQTPTDPAVSRVEVSSRPTGAHVFVGEEERGVTPLTLDVEADGELDVTLRASGYRSARRTLRGDGPEQVHITLRRARPATKQRPGLAPL